MRVRLDTRAGDVRRRGNLGSGTVSRPFEQQRSASPPYRRASLLMCIMQTAALTPLAPSPCVRRVSTISLSSQSPRLRLETCTQHTRTFTKGIHRQLLHAFRSGDPPKGTYRSLAAGHGAGRATRARHDATHGAFVPHSASFLHPLRSTAASPPPPLHAYRPSLLRCPRPPCYHLISRTPCLCVIPPPPHLPLHLCPRSLPSSLAFLLHPPLRLPHPHPR
ncbi:hypothetical protein B0H10DRAFT_2436320 [Mycena sp. CBHHK59/15]|nr:hypothetical protein B0H10DRAFT_2436320 [Mycena sp. CBHHK59/15]